MKRIFRLYDDTATYGPPLVPIDTRPLFGQSSPMGESAHGDWRRRLSFRPLPMFGSGEVRQKDSAMASALIHGLVDWEEVSKEGEASFQSLYHLAEQPNVTHTELLDPLCHVLNFLSVRCAWSFCSDNGRKNPLAIRAALTETLRKFGAIDSCGPPISTTLGIFNYLQSSANAEFSKLSRVVQSEPQLSTDDTHRSFQAFSRQHLSDDWKGPFLADYIWYYSLAASYTAHRAIAYHWAGTRQTTVAESRDMLRSLLSSLDTHRREGQDRSD